MLRLLRDAGLPTPRPLGFVEITPEREYLILMEYFEDAVEIADAEVDDRVIQSGLSVVRKLWDAGVAHRDIKPSNVLVRDGSVLLIDVAFATVRPTPWRQAVDLANMMLTLALGSTPEAVYEQATRILAPDDIAEAFAATRSVTIPNQLRARLKADGRDLATAFRRLAPPRSPSTGATLEHAANRSDVRGCRRNRTGILRCREVRRAHGAAVNNRLVAIFTTCGCALALVGCASTAEAAPDCRADQRLALVAQSVPGASYVPCVAGLRTGWRTTNFDAETGHTSFDLESDRSDRAVVVDFTSGCRVAGATPIAPRADGVRTHLRVRSISSRYPGTLYDIFPGGCVTYRFDFKRGPHIALMEDVQASLGLFSRRELRLQLHRDAGITLR